MSNYVHKYYVKQVLGFEEVSENEYTTYQHEHKAFISKLSDVLKAARCGWDEVKYKVMRHPTSGSEESYMVLCVGSDEVRWIPIGGNSKGCNLEVLGENLW